jgi:hypothetical protein
MTYNIRYPRARLSPSKQELLVIEFARRYIDTGDIKEALEILALMAGSREDAETFEGRVTFFFSGWDDDPRETAAIPEIRAWFQKLTGEWPFWLHFIEKEGDTLFHVLRLICSGHYEGIKDGMIAWRFDDLDQLGNNLEVLFGYMNGLHGRLGLPREMNRRISEEVAQLIEGAMG